MHLILAPIKLSVRFQAITGLRMYLPPHFTEADAPDDFMDSQLASIVGFEIAIDRIAGKSKLSQNREAEDFNGVRQAFEQRGEKGLAGQMERVERLRR